MGQCEPCQEGTYSAGGIVTECPVCAPREVAPARGMGACMSCGANSVPNKKRVGFPDHRATRQSQAHKPGRKLGNDRNNVSQAGCDLVGGG